VTVQGQTVRTPLRLGVIERSVLFFPWVYFYKSRLRDLPLHGIPPFIRQELHVLPCLLLWLYVAAARVQVLLGCLFAHAAFISIYETFQLLNDRHASYEIDGTARFGTCLSDAWLTIVVKWIISAVLLIGLALMLPAGARASVCWIAVMVMVFLLHNHVRRDWRPATFGLLRFLKYSAWAPALVGVVACSDLAGLALISAMRAAFAAAWYHANKVRQLKAAAEKVELWEELGGGIAGLVYAVVFSSSNRGLLYIWGAGLLLLGAARLALSLQRQRTGVS
jgi:hypothetical protein